MIGKLKYMLKNEGHLSDLKQKNDSYFLIKNVILLVRCNSDLKCCLSLAVSRKSSSECARNSQDKFHCSHMKIKKKKQKTNKKTHLCPYIDSQHANVSPSESSTYTSTVRNGNGFQLLTDTSVNKSGQFSRFVSVDMRKPNWQNGRASQTAAERRYRCWVNG